MKNNKKLLLFPAILLIASLLLSACSGNVTKDLTDAFSFGSKETKEETTEEETTIEETEKTTEETEEETTTKAPETTTTEEEDSSSGSGPDSETDYIGATYSCEKFSAVCPEGWVNNPLTDFWDDTKPDEKTLQFVKGEMESEWDLYYLASVRITCYDKTTTLLDSRDYYENTEDEEVTDLEGKVWVGFTGDYGSSRNFSLTTETEDHIFLATGLLNGSKSEFALTDEDFLTILSSVRAKDGETEESSEEESSEEETTTEEETTEEETSEETTTEEESTTKEETTKEETTEEETTTKEETSEEESTTKEAENDFSAYENVTVEYSDGYNTLNVTFEELPASVSDLEACIEEFGHNEKLTAAWFIAAMYEYTVDPKEGEKMIGFLCDPDEARSVTGFVTDQLRQKEYLATAYFKGANKDNDFTPDEPLQITLTNFDNRENNKFTYVRVACDSDKRDRTIALIEDDVVGYRVVKCPALLLGIN